MSKKILAKKFLSVALSSALAVCMLAGCGNSSGSPTASSEASSAASSGEPASTGEKVQISVYRDSMNLASPDSAEVEKIQDAINDYIGDKINVEIKLTDIGSGEFTDKANLALSNGEINLLWTASWEQTINCDNLVKQNAVYDLSDLLKGTTLYSSMPEAIWTASRYDGKDYFVPVYKESAEGYDMMFRKDLVDQHGWDLSTVKSLKDIEPMLADCKADGLKYPYLTQKTAMFHRYYLNDFDFFSQDSIMAVDRSTDEVVDVLGTQQYKDFCTLMCKWAEEGYLSEDDATKTTTDTTTQTKDWGVSWWTDVPNNAEANTRYKQDVVMAHLTDNWAHSTTTLGSCFCVAANSTEEQAKACVDFLGLLYTDQTLADLYTYGIEGADYDLNEDGKVVKKGDMYNHSTWESASVMITSLEDGEPDNKAELYKDFNEGAKTSSAAGFRLDKSDIEAKYTACLNVFDQYGFVLENGGYASADIDSTLEEYQKALDEAGYQDVLKAAQSQYDDWKASK